MSDDEGNPENEVSSNNNVPFSISGLGKLPKFNGRGNIKQFIKNIDKRAKLEHWNEDYKSSIIKYLCVDIAEAYLDSYPDIDDQNYDEVCDILKARFEPKLTKPEAYSELMSIRQNRDNINDYAGRIESAATGLADIITELSDPNERDALLISIFRAGLDSGIQKTLIANEYNDFNNIVKAAKRCESVIYKNQRNINHLNSQETQYVSQNYQNRRSNQINNRQNFNSTNAQCWQCGLSGHINRNCRNGNNNFRNDNLRMPNYQYRNRSQQSFDNPRFENNHPQRYRNDPNNYYNRNHQQPFNNYPNNDNRSQQQSFYMDDDNNSLDFNPPPNRTRSTRYNIMNLMTIICVMIVFCMFM